MNTPELVFDFDGSYQHGADILGHGFSMPVLSAENEETEGSRIHRLASAWGGACATVKLLSNRYQRHWCGAIISLRDNKGTLAIIWRDKQSGVMFEGVIMGAWERECEHAGEHTVASPER